MGPGRSSVAHSTLANVPDLRAFVHAVLEYTAARQIDIVGHSLGVTLAREWMRQDLAQRLVRRLVAIDGPNHGIVNCSPNPLNYWQLPQLGGFTRGSALCREYGADDTPVPDAPEPRGDAGPDPLPRDSNGDTSFVYFAKQDGLIAPVPAEDRTGAARLLAEHPARRPARHQRRRDGAGRLRPVPRHRPPRDPQLAAGLGPSPTDS